MFDSNSKSQSNDKHYLLDKPSTNIITSVFGLGLFVMLATSLMLLLRIVFDIYRVSQGMDSVANLMVLAQQVSRESPSDYLALKIVAFTNWLLFDEPGVYRALTQGFDVNNPSWFERFVTTFKWQFIVAIQSVSIVSSRLGTVLSILPIVALVYLLAFVDGMVERGIRTQEAGRESTSIHLQAKAFHWGGMMLLIMIYTLWPGLVSNLELFVAVWLLISWFNIRLQWKYYKKYW